MKEEPELIDIMAMFALVGIIHTYRGESTESAALTAYEYAAEMMKARKHHLEGGSDE